MGLGEILEGHASTAMIAIHSVISSLAAAQLLLVNITTSACTIAISMPCDIAAHGITAVRFFMPPVTL